MNLKIKFLPAFLVAMVVFTSCGIFGGKGGKDVSSTTGWKYNDPENGGFEVIQNFNQETGPGLVLIEGGTFTMGRVTDDLTYDWNNIPRRVTLSSYYMDETEVRNVDYREYLYWLRRVYVSYPQVYRNALPDTLVWRSPLAFNESYVEYYLRFPSYNDYPVVGVSWVQASNYCLWRTDRVNEMILIREGILNQNPNQIDADNFTTDAYLANQYEGLVNQNLPSLDPNKEERRVMMEDGILLPRYRLPTEAEWEYAAYALIGNTFEERLYERRMYPWDGHHLRNPKLKVRGKFMANFIRGRGDYMGLAGDLNDNASITSPVTSYWPNDYGLYCMAGNVNEWVQDVYRPMSFQDFDALNPFRGNVFTTLVRDEEGNVVEKDSLGHLKEREITPEEAAGRYNFTKADYRNYADGSGESSINRDLWTGEESGNATSMMYSQDLRNQDFTSLINDNARVYKGGSWRDRAYWLNPSTRRFLDQNSARADLGFRCAMIRVGSPSGF